MARGTGAVTDGGRKSEGCIRARTLGNDVALGPSRAKACPCRCELQEGTMANALTLENMSPELLKVVDRAKREPEGRFHSLAHLIDMAALKRAYHRQRGNAAVGVDGVM